MTMLVALLGTAKDLGQSRKEQDCNRANVDMMADTQQKRTKNEQSRTSEHLVTFRR